MNYEKFIDDRSMVFDFYITQIFHSLTQKTAVAVRNTVKYSREIMIQTSRGIVSFR